MRSKSRNELCSSSLSSISKPYSIEFRNSRSDVAIGQTSGSFLTSAAELHSCLKIRLQKCVFEFFFVQISKKVFFSVTNWYFHDFCVIIRNAFDHCMCMSNSIELQHRFSNECLRASPVDVVFLKYSTTARQPLTTLFKFGTGCKATISASSSSSVDFDAKPSICTSKYKSCTAHVIRL